MLHIGELVDNKYKILSEVGHGGMSVVYLAINERANKTWAVKEVRKDGVCDFEAVKQGLIVETDMLKKLNHPHLPSIIDVIDTEDSFLIVMDYIEGKSLQSVLKKAGAQPQDQVIKWSIQLCDVLGYLHSRTPSIIYRDMKPANVMLKPSGDITLIDFGTAREFKNRSMVEDTTCLGTRGYAAPEQFGGRGQTDPRTDIYCLGATMYHLITGHSPAEPPYEIKPLSYWNPVYYGSGLEQIVNKCCQQDPQARYQSCAELMYDLEHVQDMDLVTQQRRKKKWASFIASIVVCAVGLGGMLGTYFLKQNAISKSYDHSIQQAKMEIGGSDLTKLSEYIFKAVEVDPERPEAYSVLLDAIEYDALFDTQTELPLILQCINGTTKGDTTTNMDQLLASDQATYAEVNYRIGKLLALVGDGSNDNLAKASVYFTNALEDGGMATSTDPSVQKQALLAQSLSTIGSSIGQLKTTGSSGGHFVGDGEDRYTYVKLWEDLENLQANFRIDSMDSHAYGIALYGRIAFMISNDIEYFIADGISTSRIQGLLDRLNSALLEAKELPTVEERYADLFETALGNVNNAQNKLNTQTDSQPVAGEDASQQGGDEE